MWQVFPMGHCHFIIHLCDVGPEREMAYDAIAAPAVLPRAKTTATSVGMHASEIERPATSVL
jgi:hypothetical protein